MSYLTQSINSESPSIGVSNILISNATSSRPAFSWCSKCGQSMEISTESNLHKSKTNFKFRKIFDFEESEVLVKTFSCALVDEILLQGTLYASQNFFCFFSRIANKQKKVIISIEKIVEITKEKTAGIFPNAIAVRTEHNRHLFSSFMHREIAFRCLNEVWTNRQNEKLIPNWISKILLNDDMAEDEEYDEESYPEMELIENRKTSNKLPQFPAQYLDPNAVRDYKNMEKQNQPSIVNCIIRNIFSSISKEKIQLITAISILIFLMFYIIILAWKIHDFQMILIDKFSGSCNQMKVNLKNIECPLYDTSCKIQKESILDHQDKMSKVLSNLKDTLNLLQNVVEISGQMFSKLRPVSLSSIIGSGTKGSGDN